MERLKESAVTSANVLKTVRFEAKHRERLSTNTYTDADATKQVMDKLINGKMINGFVREIGLDPFGFLLMAQIQVRFQSQPGFLVL